MNVSHPTASYACPRCGVALSVAHAGGAVLHGCMGCGGIWLDMPTSHRFCDALDGHAHSLIESGEKYASYVVETHAPVSCPVCQTVLVRTRLQHASVDIDYCGHHGSWFDKGELIRIAQAASVARAYGSGASNPHAAAAQAPPARKRSDDDDGDSVDAADTALFGVEVLVSLASVFAD